MNKEHIKTILEQSIFKNGSNMSNLEFGEEHCTFQAPYLNKNHISQLCNYFGDMNITVTGGTNTEVIVGLKERVRT